MDYDEGYDYDYDEGYDDYDWRLSYDCPDVTMANVLRNWLRAIKNKLWSWFSKEDVSDIPF